MSKLTISLKGQPDKTYELWPEPHRLEPGFLCENESYFIELLGVEAPEDFELFVDGVERLTALRSPNRSTARWEWKIGFYAGKVNLLLVSKSHKWTTIEVVTDPLTEKIVRDQFELMIQEILTDTLSLFSLSSFRVGITKGTGTFMPAIVRLEYLRSRLGAIEEAVRAIDMNPVRILRSQVEMVPLHKTRRILSREIVKSFQKASGGFQIIRGKRSLGLSIRYLPADIVTRKKSSGLDIVEHQAIKCSIRMWMAWLAEASSNLASIDSADYEVTLRQRVWSNRCKAMRGKLGTLLDLPMFSEVSDRWTPLALTTIFRKINTYNNFFRLHKDFQLGIANVVGDYLDLPLARTFELYELWAFLRLLRAAIVKFAVDPVLLTSLFDLDDKRRRLKLLSADVTIPIGSGRAIAFKRRYKEYWFDSHKRGSFSRHMIPDISILSGSDGVGEFKVVVLDAKYRIESDINEAIASIHTYRDALVREDEKRGSKRIVAGAYLLSPYFPEYKSSWKSTRMPGRLFHPEYRREFKFGAVSLWPGMTLEDVGASLNSILEDVGFC